MNSTKRLYYFCKLSNRLFSENPGFNFYTVTSIPENYNIH